MPTCPVCTHTWLSSKPKGEPLSVLSVTERAALTTTELYAYYHRTAPRDDIAFVFKACPELAQQFDWPTGYRPTATDARRVFDAFRMHHPVWPVRMPISSVVHE